MTEQIPEGFSAPAIGDTVIIRDTDDVCSLNGAHACMRGSTGIVRHDNAALYGGVGYWVECRDGEIRGYLPEHLENRIR